jgi:hypothetical protein
MCGAALEEIAEERQMQFTILRLLVGGMGLVLAASAQRPGRRPSFPASKIEPFRDAPMMCAIPAIGSAY